ncbi:CPBP family intramembrane glutamic endopeptidase [Bifidobacterium saguinibicoloris]|uniref:CPBP family intramembrane glutamic endopeptidase n=1 Tax=Bifidobacterium saguinibicoloris TaxID=2834433 RepID=UPI001C58A4A5|nr:CPBP family intramembrane glutamic endopeptidase [Bifidobacterium saguinibicoloris]MBW3080252.1 CPBP family intramembrane metalloprotease [Bifidobacterium saguinibicoloris]
MSGQTPQPWGPQDRPQSQDEPQSGAPQSEGPQSPQPETGRPQDPGRMPPRFDVPEEQTYQSDSGLWLMGQPPEPPQGPQPGRPGHPGGGSDGRAGGASLFEAHRRFVLIGVGLCVVIAVWVGLGMVIGGLLDPYFPNGAPVWVTLAVSGVPLYCVAMPLSMLVFARVPVLKVRQFPLDVRRFLTMLAVCFPIMMAGNLIGSGLSKIISGGTATNRINDLIANGDIWVNALFMVLIAPFFEEWMFRRQLIDRTRRYGERTSIALSAFAFALFHMNLFQFFYAFGIGLVFGYVYMRTGRLRYSVAMHMILNANGALVAPLVMSLAGDQTSRIAEGTMTEQEMMAAAQANPGIIGVLLYSFVLMAVAVGGVVLLARNWRAIEFYDPPERLPGWQGVRIAFLNPAMIVYTVLTIVLGLWQMGILTFG